MKKILILLTLITTVALNCNLAIAEAETESMSQEEEILENSNIESAELADNSETVSIVLRPENFTLVNISPEIDATTSDDAITGVLPEGKFFTFRDHYVPDGDEKRVYAEIFLPQEGNYEIWAMTKDWVNNATGSRWMQFSVDGVLKEYKYNSNGTGQTINGGFTGWRWEKGESVNLAKGLHTIEVANCNSMPRLCAILVTNDADFDPNEADYATEIKNLEDLNTFPAFNSEEIQFDFYDSQSIIAQWSSAVDEKGIAGYSVYVNDSVAPNILLPDTLSFVVNEFSRFDRIKLKIEAFDLHGHKAVLEGSTIFNNLELKEVVLTDEHGESIFVMNDMKDKSQLLCQYTLKSETEGEKDLLLGLGIYNKETGEMVSAAQKSFILDGTVKSTETILLELPIEVSETPQRYKIYMSVWDNATNIEPQIPGVLFE